MAYDASGNSGNNPTTGQPLAANAQPQAPQSDSQPLQQPSTTQSSGQAPASSQSKIKASKPRSGMFTNIQSYVEKNQPQGAKMAQVVNQNLQQTAQAVQAKTNELAQNFQSSVQRGQIQDMGQAVSDVEQRARQAAQATYQAPQQTFTEGMKDTESNGRAESPFGFNPPKQPTLFGEEHKEYAQKDFLGDKYDQYRKDMDQALSNFTPGDDASLRNLSEVEESYGLTGNWFDKYKDIDPSKYLPAEAAITGGKVQQQPVTLLDQPQATPVTPQVTDDRIAAILNARYAGPTDVTTQAGFQDVMQRTQQAQDLIDSALSGDKARVIDETFGGEGYTQGQRVLDEMIFGSNLANVQGDIQGIGNLNEQLATRQQELADLAIQGAQDVTTTRDDARQALLNIAQARQGEVDTRLSQVVKGWDQLPEQFKDVLRTAQGGGPLELSELEAQTLGVGEGTGLYNLLQDDASIDELIGTVEADRQRLVSQDEFEQMRQLEALTRLAQGGLGFESEFFDPEQAGTQSALDALDVSGIRERLIGAEEGFQDLASQDIVGVGKGKAKYNRGMGRGRKTVKRQATETANLQDILEDAGYNFEQQLGEGFQEVDTNVLKDLARISQQSKGDVFTPEPLEEGDETDLLNVSALGNADESIWNYRSPHLGKLLTAQGVVDRMSDVTGAVGQAISDVPQGVLTAGADLVGKGLETIGIDVPIESITAPLSQYNIPTQVLGGFSDALSDASSSVFGGGKKEARKKAEYKAKKAALQDLQNKIQSTFKESGFDNRAQVVDNEVTQERTLALQALIDSLDKTNL